MAQGRMPLVGDLDGTLTPTDTLFEAMPRLFKSAPWAALLPVSLLAGRAVLNHLRAP